MANKPCQWAVISQTIPYTARISAMAYRVLIVNGQMPNRSPDKQHTYGIVNSESDEWPGYSGHTSPSCHHYIQRDGENEQHNAGIEFESPCRRSIDHGAADAHLRQIEDIVNAENEEYIFLPEAYCLSSPDQRKAIIIIHPDHQK